MSTLGCPDGSVTTRWRWHRRCGVRCATVLIILDIQGVIVPDFIRGIDIYNGTGEVDFAKIKAADRVFCLVKVSEGMNFTGMVIGAYHFLRKESDPTQQAEYYLSRGRQLGRHPRGDGL
jgi:hypothetical protein